MEASMRALLIGMTCIVVVGMLFCIAESSSGSVEM
jgi:hypothetical protein